MNYQKKVWWKRKKRFCNACKFYNNDINKFISLLQKVVYPCEYMDDWEIKVLLSEIGDFHSHLNMADISNADYMHAKSVWKDFQTRNLSFMSYMFRVIHYC